MNENSPLHIPLIVGGPMIFIAFAAGLYHRLKLVNFAPFKSLTLTNKYYVVSISSGLLVLSCLNNTNKRWSCRCLIFPRFKHKFIPRKYSIKAPH